MKSDRVGILTVNCGSSSIKFVLYETGQRLFSGKVDRIGLSGTRLTARDGSGKPQPAVAFKAANHRQAADFLLDWLEKQPDFGIVAAVGHRVVHGMAHSEPELVTPKLLAELHRLKPYDPEHLPREIELIKAFRERHPKLRQVACFDTAFHRTMPPVARMLAVPRRYWKGGMQRYGFHGISYTYLMEELARLGDRSAKRGRVILAHLGNGASMAAVLNGKSLDTSMGFTPAAGLVMSTRAGDLDPGLLSYLSRTYNMTARQFEWMVNHEAGLLGVSGISSDMRDLLAAEKRDAHAAEAIALFCYQAKKWIGAYAAALGGLDTLVFAGGIGENCPSVRRRICAGLYFLGVGLDAPANHKNVGVISAATSQVAVRVIHTDEEMMIARSVSRLLHLQPMRKPL